LGSNASRDLGFYGKLASRGHEFFNDDDFAAAYSENNGRPSCPPSILAMARLLQHYEGISDGETVERCKYDLRWKTALDMELASVDALFAKSTFQAFRARLTLHGSEGLVFERSVTAARDAGLLPEKLRVALDSSPVRGRGAVKDTFNLLSDAIVAVVRAVASEGGKTANEVAVEAKLERHVAAESIKGSEVVDWEDQQAVGEFLDGLLEDCEQAVTIAKEAECATEDAALLRKVVEQDVEVGGENGPPSIKRGVARERTVSVSDPDMRHGRKSSGKVYSGHKAHVAVEVSSGVITAVDMTPPSGADGAQVKSLLEKTEQITERTVGQALGDSAYSSRTAIDEAAEAEVELVSKMPSPPKGRHGPGAFQVSEDGTLASCPAGISSSRVKRSRAAHLHEWSADNCAGCALKNACTKARRRTLLVPPDFHERRRRERYASSEEGRAVLRRRVAVEHAIGRVKNLGAGAARYFGRGKTRAQWLWTAAVANLSLVWGREVAVGA
jgi:transposase